ncbi:MAG TPA: tetratricopeptide repeat protein [Sphingomonas sp.]|nr:tetratricopeptide repeat protein [Sphingomonas sp.]
MEAPIIPTCKRILLAGAAALVVAAPAWAAAQPADLAAYLKARAADADGNAAVAVASYAVALEAAPNNPVIALRAYRAALDAGDDTLTDRAASVLSRAGAAPADSGLVALAAAVQVGDARGADAAIDRLDGTPLAFLTPVLRAWHAYERGDADPIAKLTAGNNPIGRRYYAENRALLLIATGHTDDGVAAARALLAPDQGSFDFRIAAAQLLAAKGNAELGRSLLAGDDPVLSAFRESLGQGVKAGLAFGASRLFDRLASDLSHDDTSPLTVVLARSALRMDPRDDRARLLLAQALEGRDETPLALAALDGIDPQGPFAAIARAARVAVLDDAGEEQKALDAAARLNAGSGATAADAQRYGDALIALERYAEAAKAYDQAIQRAGAAADWTLYLQKGGALEQAGNWPEARAALAKAVAMAPDEPLALNYLGYAEIEHGGDLAAAQKLLEKANALKPGDPAITDSLGWAYFKRGDAAKALPLFERAVKGQPADETINEHLGDAYWKTGRRFEARYAWRAAAVTAEGADKTRLLAKIENGLGPGPVAN